MSGLRVLFACSLGGSGHLNPLLPAMAEARRLGHEVRVVGPAGMARTVEEQGYPFWPGGEPPEATLRPLREQLPRLPRRQAAVLGNREIFGRMATSWMLPEMERVVAQWRPDRIVREPCEYASAIVAAEMGIPVVQLAVSLAEVEDGSIGAAASALEEHRDGLTALVRATPYWTRFPSTLDPSPFPTTCRYREPGADVTALPPLGEWWGGRDGPLVYLSFGTVLGHLSFAPDLYRLALAAVRHLEARVLMTVGHRVAVSELGPIPEHVHVEQWVDQERVLDQATAVISHGGSGTTFGALAAGVPVVVVPVFGDQIENGRRVARAGVGRAVLPRSDEAGIDPDTVPFDEGDLGRIEEAVREVLGDPRYRQAARGVADEMARAPSLAALLDPFLDPDR